MNIVQKVEFPSITPEVGNHPIEINKNQNIKTSAHSSVNGSNKTGTQNPFVVSAPKRDQTKIKIETKVPGEKLVKFYQPHKVQGEQPAILGQFIDIKV